MNKHKKILYIGNALAKKTNYKTSMETITVLMEKENIKVYSFSNKMNKLLRFIDMCKAVITHRKKVDYIIIDTYSTLNFYYALATSQLARVFKLKYIPVLRGGNLPYKLKKSPFFSKLVFKNAYKNIAPSNYLKEAFEKKGFLTEFIPNVLEIEKYTFKKREVLNPKLLWVRSLKALYNPVMAIEVLHELKKEYPNATLCIIGPFAEKETHQKVLAKIKEYKLISDVELTGVLTKEQWHKKSEEFDIFINTTNFDNTPVSVMEAMALGLPVVSTNVGGMPYLLDSGVDGILVEKENPKMMVNEIINLIQKNRQDIALNARKKVESFGWNIVKKQWFEILK